MTIIIALMFMCCSVEGRIQIRQTGSSTVYPFAVKIAQEFSKKTMSVCPLVESTSTSSGFTDFSQAYNGFEYDIASASRPINPEELIKCKKTGVVSILEICIGIDGIALATKKNLTGFNDLRLKDIFTAIIKKITNNKGEVIDNPYKKWKEINPNLPDVPIRILIPSLAHGTRDAFKTMVMRGSDGIRSGLEVREISDYEAADSHHLLFDFLENNPTTMAFVVTNLLEDYAQIKAMQIDGIEPTHSNIQNGTYPMVRKLFIYVRDNKTEGLQDYIDEWLSPAAIGKDGYLTKMGLVPLLENVQRRRKL